MAESAELELEMLKLFGQEFLKRVFSEVDPSDIRAWALKQLGKADVLNAKNVLMAWEDTFEFYDSVLEQRAARSLLPADERREFKFPWESWNSRIDSPDEADMLVMLSAAPGTGKTIWGEMVAERNAQEGLFGVFAHWELNGKVMLDRRAVRHTRVPRAQFRQGILTPAQIANLDEDGGGAVANSKGLGEWILLSKELRTKLNEANTRMRLWKGGVDYWHTTGWDVDLFVREVKAADAERKLDYVIVDYFGKIGISPRQTKIYGQNTGLIEVDTIEQLKQLAESIHVPVVVLTQLTKGGRSKPEGVDSTDIRGRGELTERANIVALLQLIETDGLPDQIKVNVAKNTLGATGTWNQIRLPQWFMIADIEEQSW